MSKKDILKASFVVGSYVLSAAAGAFGASLYWRKRCRQEVQKAEESLKAYFKKTKEEAKKEAREETVAELAKDEEILKQALSFSEKIQEEKIYIIKPDDYGDDPNYAKYTYTYYPDNAMYVSMYDLPVDDEEMHDILGEDICAHIEDHFGQFDNDAVYVRNEELQTDVAIYLADGAYEEK